MSFPRAPKKPVTGQLKLSIKSPTQVEVKTVDPREEYQDKRDLSSQLKFNLPLGFSQDAKATRAQDKDRDKALRQAYAVQDSTKAEHARRVVEFSHDWLKSTTNDYVSMVLRDQSDGALFISFANQRIDKELWVLVKLADLKVAKYLGNTQVTLIDKISLHSPEFINQLIWLVA